ncbi:MAG: hypothetical protein E6G42_10455 [Actinobacteria bacterium]|nr:MAG: hypothetical protein E6G42_10455 [Actinomycetota bacterium]
MLQIDCDDHEIDVAVGRGDESLPRPGRPRLQLEPDPHSELLFSAADELEREVRIEELTPRIGDSPISDRLEPIGEPEHVNRQKAWIGAMPGPSLGRDVDVDVQPIRIPAMVVALDRWILVGDDVEREPIAVLVLEDQLNRPPRPPSRRLP